MKQKNFIVKVVAVITISMLTVSFVQARADENTRKIEDWKRAAELFTFYYQKLNSKYAFTGQEDEYIKNWKKWRTDLTTFQTEFKKKYGQTAKEVAAKFDGISPPSGVGNSMRQICQDLFSFDAAAKEKEIAGWAADAGDKAYTKWKNFTPPNATKMELKVNYAERALSSYEFAFAVHSDGGYDDKIKKAKAAIAESEMAWKKTLQELKWPGQNKDFKGPGDPEELAQEALKLLQTAKSWSKPEYDDEHRPIAACVTGKDWTVYKRVPLTRVPTQYSLNFLVAFAGTKDPDIAYAYHMVFYTKEEAGVKKETPFHYVNSRQYAKYKILMSNVPKMLYAEGGPAAVSTTHTGFFGFFFRLCLALLLITVGIVGAENLLGQFLPQLKPVCSALKAKQKIFGWAILWIGIICMLRSTMIYFSPLADLLPQIVAILMGLVLLGDSLPKAISEKLEGVIRQLSNHADQLGIAAALLGFVHLFAAGLTLL